MSDERDVAAALALTEELLGIASPIGHEAEITDWLEARCRAGGMAEVVRASNSLCVAPHARDPRRPLVLLVGHVDTVPALGENPVRTEGDRLHGLGASDMKAADALILWALERALQDRPRDVDVAGVLYAREEGPYDESEMPLIHAAARAWFDDAELAVCMEPTDNAIELGCLGTSHATFTFHGQRAHSARPWQGANAIHAAAGLFTRLAAFDRRRFEFCGLEFFEVASATMVEFRGARNVVPDRFDVNVNFRFAPGRDRADVERELATLAAGEADVTLVDYCPAGRVCGDNPHLAALRQAAGDPPTRAKQAWTDVGRLSELGIDAINWGPGATAQAHQANEWVSRNEVAASLRTLRRWLWPDDDAVSR